MAAGRASGLLCGMKDAGEVEPGQGDLVEKADTLGGLDRVLRERSSPIEVARAAATLARSLLHVMSL